MQAGSAKVRGDYTPPGHIRFSTVVGLESVLLPVLHLIGIRCVLSVDVDGTLPHQQGQCRGGDEHAPGHIGIGFIPFAQQRRRELRSGHGRVPLQIRERERRFLVGLVMMS